MNTKSKRKRTRRMIRILRISVPLASCLVLIAASIESASVQLIFFGHDEFVCLICER